MNYIITMEEFLFNGECAQTLETMQLSLLEFGTIIDWYEFDLNREFQDCTNPITMQKHCCTICHLTVMEGWGEGKSCHNDF